MDEIERIREEYRTRDRTIPSDFYAWHRAEIQYWQANTARICARLLRENNAFPITDSAIADIGCGNGNWLLEFLQWGATSSNLHGIDLLADRVTSAQQRLPGADLRCGDARELPWPDDSFDLVTQFTVFSSVADVRVQAQMASEMLRVLRKGGRILWYDCRHSNPASAVRGVSRNDVQKLFPSCSIHFEKTTLLPPLARAVARRSWALAALLESLRFTCTHLAAVITPNG